MFLPYINRNKLGRALTQYAFYFKTKEFHYLLFRAMMQMKDSRLKQGGKSFPE